MIRILLLVVLIPAGLLVNDEDPPTGSSAGVSHAQPG